MWTISLLGKVFFKIQTHLIPPNMFIHLLILLSLSLSLTFILSKWKGFLSEMFTFGKCLFHIS